MSLRFTMTCSHVSRAIARCRGELGVVAASSAAVVAATPAAAVAASFVGEAVVDAVELEGVVAELGLRCPGVFGLEQPVSVTRRSFPLQVRQ